MNSVQGRIPSIFLRDRIFLIFAGVFTAMAVYVYPLFLSTPLIEPDEGLHATISQEMLEQNEWIVPQFRGTTFPDKPILFFWAQMVSLKTFGMNEAGVRFAGLMFGLLGALTTGLLGGRLFGSRAGYFSALIQMSMVIPMSLAQAAAHDVALVPWTNLAMLCLWETERSKTTGRQYCWLTGAIFMIGLAILTKALIGVALVAVGFGGFLLVGRRLSWQSGLRFLIAIGGGAIVASPWYLAMELRNSGYLYYYFVERHLLGFTTSTQQHGQTPWWYYAPVLLLGATPWGWYVPLVLRDEWSRSRFSRAAPEFLLLLCWLVGGILFLSIAGSKLVTYALPLFPVIAILSGVAWQNKAESRSSEWSDYWLGILVRLAAVAGAVVPCLTLIVCQYLFDAQWSASGWMTAVATAVISVVAWKAFSQKQYERNVGLASAWMACMTVLVLSEPFPYIIESHSERSLARWINEKDCLPEKLILIGEKPASLIFYLHEDLRRQLKNEQFFASGLNELLSPESRVPGTIVAVTRSMLDSAEVELQSIPGTNRGAVGQFILFEYETDPPPLPQSAMATD